MLINSEDQIIIAKRFFDNGIAYLKTKGIEQGHELFEELLALYLKTCVETFGDLANS